MLGSDVHQTDMRTMSGCTPVQSESHTSWGRGSFQAARSQTAGPATACEERCASWHLSGSGWGPWCSWGPFAGFHTWTVFCPGPTGGPLYVSDQTLCSNPASSSSLWHWQPSVASWQSHTSLGSWSPVPRTRIQSQCSWVDETSWFLKSQTSDCRQIRTSQLQVNRFVREVSSVSFRVPRRSPQPGWCPSCVSFVLRVK